MKRDYELVVIFDGSVPEDVAAKEKETVSGFLAANGAENAVLTDWGKRQLAYDISKKKSGYYSYFEFSAEGTIVEKIEKAMKLNLRVLRHMTVIADKRPFVLPPEEMMDKNVGEGEEE